MTTEQINRWIDSIETDLANVACADDAWKLRELARAQVFESRGLKPEPVQNPLWDTKPGQVS